MVKYCHLHLRRRRYRGTSRWARFLMGEVPLYCEGKMSAREESLLVGYRGTSPIRKRPPPQDPPSTLDIGLR